VSEAALEASREIEKLLKDQTGLRKTEDWLHSPGQDFMVMTMKWRRPLTRKQAKSEAKAAFSHEGFEELDDRLGRTIFGFEGVRVYLYDYPDMIEVELKEVNPRLTLAADYGAWANEKRRGMLSFWRKEIEKGSRSLAPAAIRTLECLRNEIRKDPNVEAYVPFLEYDESDSIGERQDLSDQMGLDSRMADHASLICFDVGWVGEPRRDAKRYTKASLKRAISAAGFKLFKPGAAELEGLLGEARVLVWENDPWDNRDGEFKVVLARVQAKPLLSGTDAGPWARAQQIPKVQKKTKKLGSRTVSDAARRMMTQISDLFKADPEYRVSRWDVPSQRPFASPVDRDDEVSLAFDWNPAGKDLENVNDWEWARNHAVEAASAKLIQLGFAQISIDTHGALFKKGRAEARLWWIRDGLSLHLYDVEPKHTLGGDKGAWARAAGSTNRRGSRTVSPAAQEMMEVLAATFKADRRYEVSEWSSGPEDRSRWSSKRRLGLRWWSVEGDVDSRRQAAMRDVQHRLKQLGFQVASIDLGSCDFELHGPSSR
jgi:hypothetical protein